MQKLQLLVIASLASLMLIGTAVTQEPSPLGPNQTPGQQSNDSFHAENCMVGYIDKVDIPAETQGKIKSLKIEEGMTVKQDDLVAMIDDTQARLNLELKRAEEEEAILNATNDINKKDAVNSEKIAKAEAESYKDLHKEGATPYWELQKKILEADRARLRISLADMQMKIAKAQYFAKRSELRIAEDEINRRKITAPFDGFIEKRHAQMGQWVQPGSPIATLVRMDKLKVEGDVDVQYASQIERGAPVIVEIYHRSDAAEPMRVEATLTYKSTEIDLNNRHRIWVEIQNQSSGNDDWVIKPGMRAEIIIKGVTTNRDDGVF